MLPQPHSSTDRHHWATLFTRARLRKGWTYQRLACEAELHRDTVIQACLHGRCHSETVLKLLTALDVSISLPTPLPVMTAQQAQRG